MIGPILTTSRLTLRPHALSDYEDCLAMRADPNVMQFLGGVLGPEAVWARLLRYAGHWVLIDYGFWAVRETSSGRFVGEVGFSNYPRGLGDGFDGVPEAGWVLAAWAQGQGFAAEAVAAIFAWSDAQPKFARTVAMIDPENARSLRLAAQLGFTTFRTSDYGDHKVALLERSAKRTD